MSDRKRRVFALERGDAELLAPLINDEELRALLSRGSASLGAEPAGDPLQIELTRSQIDTMLNCLADLLSEVGMKDDDEPNAIGLRIEALIDKFNRGRWENSIREEP